ncbi:SH3 domain-containing protein [Xenococcus sp. PCC 7305]|uniref:SH3 domain-containing protein n=1 Tax=Xenococcus sp. PCC 7305 TaxID=102125 RepID=UPI0002F92D1C|nr:SH3 domain-containing protein [Xenococcus sp. PCC 7305]
MTKQQTWVSTISSIFQFILGFVLGVALIAGIGAGAAYFYFTKMSSHTPTKPAFEEAEPLPLPEQDAIAKSDSAPTSETAAQPEPTPEPEPIPEPEPELPANAYFARVTWPQGLSLRAEPSLDAERVGGIGYNARIIILEDSSDKKWQRIRIPESQREAWVKAGNVEKE